MLSVYSTCECLCYTEIDAVLTAMVVTSNGTTTHNSPYLAFLSLHAAVGQKADEALVGMRLLAFHPLLRYFTTNPRDHAEYVFYPPPPPPGFHRGALGEFPCVELQERVSKPTLVCMCLSDSVRAAPKAPCWPS